MQCNACVEICPVGHRAGADHQPAAARPVEEGELDDGLQNVLEAIATSGNSFGETRRKRGRWTRELDFEVTDARKEPVDVLWFVGDYASLRPAQPAQHARARAAAARRRRRLRDPLRRRAQRGQRRPPGRGRRACSEPRRGEHRSARELLVRADPDQRPALASTRCATSTRRSARRGRPTRCCTTRSCSRELLDARRADGRAAARAHRSPTTTRAPSAATTAATTRRASCSQRLGFELVEMPRNRDNSFCCGAGGGRIWMREPPGASAPSENRIHEAVALGGGRPLRGRLPEGRDDVRGRDQDHGLERPARAGRAVGAGRSRRARSR